MCVRACVCVHACVCVCVCLFNGCCEVCVLNWHSLGGHLRPMRFIGMSVHALTESGYKTSMGALIYGSLGHVHKLCVRGLQIAGLNKSKAKQLAKYCSISAVIGSLHIWRRRCHLYP